MMEPMMESPEVARFRAESEAEQREETERLFPGATIHHFEGGSAVMLPPDETGHRETRVLLYGIIRRPACP